MAERQTASWQYGGAEIRNARGQIKELRILDWSRVEPLVADDGEVFYRITPDRNCGITEAVTVPARK
ncbi:hypothetical protein [Escherichia coli]|uniref:hypothetical protein n=1 Tax=Escherichia coli TaxID=562 RepID=UPI00207C141B|nr:hypothetical protein [Escherichia coli]